MVTSFTPFRIVLKPRPCESFPAARTTEMLRREHATVRLTGLEVNTELCIKAFAMMTSRSRTQDVAEVATLVSTRQFVQ